MSTKSDTYGGITTWNLWFEGVIELVDDNVINVKWDSRTDEIVLTAKYLGQQINARGKDIGLAACNLKILIDTMNKHEEMTLSCEDLIKSGGTLSFSETERDRIQCVFTNKNGVMVTGYGDCIISAARDAYGRYLSIR